MYITSCVSHIKLRGGCRCMLTHNQARKLCTHVSANLAHKTLKQVLPAAAQQLAQQNITSYQDTSGGTVLVKHRLRFRKHGVVHAQHTLTFILNTHYSTQHRHVLVACSTAMSGSVNFLFKVLFKCPSRYLSTIRFNTL